VANIKSQIKRNKQNEIHRLRNKAVRSELKTRVKTAVRVASAASPDNPEEALGAVEAVRSAVQRLDKAAEKGIIHKNQAARRKSRLMKRINSL
jgi:small subunit ribosomal protein S20